MGYSASLPLHWLFWALVAAPFAGFADQPLDVRVVNVSTNNGIAGVPLRMVQYGQTLYSGVTDAAGRFHVDSAKSGPYTVTYNVVKFWPVDGEPNRPIQVGSGADALTVDIGMTAMSTISGRVLDGTGKPVAKARIDLTATTPPGGGWIFDTDEKGEFRSDAMRAGTWTLAATAPLDLAPPASTKDRPLGWAHTWYPGVTSREFAAHLVIQPGADLQNLEIRLAALPVHRIRGVVLDVSGKPAPKLAITLDRQEPPAMHAESGSDGAFELDGVVDGDCRLSATLDSGGPKLRAARWVAVHGRDLENVELRLEEPFSLAGRVVVEVPDGAAAPKLPGIAVRSTDGFGGFEGILAGIGIVDATPDATGAFTLRKLYPASYMVMTGPPPAGYYLDAIRLGGRDAVAFDTQILPSDLPLTVTYKTNGGTVRGTAEACGKGSVVLVPQDLALRRDGFVQRANCDAEGRYEIGAVRPGEYFGLKVAAGDSVGQRRLGFAGQVDLNQELLNRAARVTVRSNEATALDLK